MSTLSTAATKVVGSAPTTRQELLHRAKSYPFERTQCSFIYANGIVMPFSPKDWIKASGSSFGAAPSADAIPSFPGLGELPVLAEDGSLERLDEQLEAAGIPTSLLSPEGGWFPVFAIGSNAGPRQLLRKYGGEAYAWPKMDCVIPCLRVSISDFDVVYTPFISSYGSCPATIQESPGTQIEVWITYLSELAIKRMHQTEGGYNLVRIPGIKAAMLDNDVPLAKHTNEAHRSALPGEDFYSYVCREGCATLDGQNPVSLTEISAVGRTNMELRQPEMLEHIHKLVVPGGGSGEWPTTMGMLDDWIMINIESNEARQSVRAVLQENYSIPSKGPWEVVNDDIYGLC